VHSGDVIVSVNGIPASKKTLLELQRLFSSTRPESMRLEIDRLGSVRAFQFKLRKASDIARQNGWRLAGGRLIPVFAAGDDPLCFPSSRDVMFDRTMDIPGTVTGGFVEAHWIEDGNSFWFAQGGSGDTSIFKYDPLKRTRVPLFNAERVRAALIPLAGHDIPGKGLPFDRLTFLPGEKAARFSFENRDFVLDLSSYSIQPVPPEPRWKGIATRPDSCPKPTWLGRRRSMKWHLRIGDSFLGPPRANFTCAPPRMAARNR
jgi:hypothetical protein